MMEGSRKKTIENGSLLMSAGAGPGWICFANSSKDICAVSKQVGSIRLFDTSLLKFYKIRHLLKHSTCPTEKLPGGLFWRQRNQGKTPTPRCQKSVQRSKDTQFCFQYVIAVTVAYWQSDNQSIIHLAHHLAKTNILQSQKLRLKCKWI